MTGIWGGDLRVNGMLDAAELDWSAIVGEGTAVGLQVGLHKGHILALEDVPNGSCPSIPAFMICALSWLYIPAVLQVRMQYYCL